MNTWREPGKGRKQCPKCKLYIPARALTCVCQGGGGDKKEEKKEVTIWKEGGKGRKPCPCGIFVPVRTAVCPQCGHTFEAKAKEPKVEKVESPASSSSKATEPVSRPRRVLNVRTRIIDTPAGKCPVGPLDDLAETEIALWAQRVREHGLKRNVFYSLRAIKYFVRETWDVNSDEYRLVCGYFEYKNRRSSYVPGVLDNLGLEEVEEVEEDEEVEEEIED